MRIKYVIISIIAIISLNGCGGSNNNNSRENDNQRESAVYENITFTKQEGYNRGYQDGHRDGYGWMQYGVSYDHTNKYQTSEGIQSYKKGYEDGYSDGYQDGENEYKAEKEAERMKDPHNWDSEDIEGFYVLLDGVRDSDEADYYSREYYDGEYIYEWGDYYAKTSDIHNGEYEITLGSRVNSKLFKIIGSDLYIHFKWMTDLSHGDEGVADIFAGHGTFYINPNN